MYVQMIITSTSENAHRAIPDYVVARTQNKANPYLAIRNIVGLKVVFFVI